MSDFLMRQWVYGIADIMNGSMDKKSSTNIIHNQYYFYFHLINKHFDPDATLTSSNKR